MSFWRPRPPTFGHTMSLDNAHYVSKMCLNPGSLENLEHMRCAMGPATDQSSQSKLNTIWQECWSATWISAALANARGAQPAHALGHICAKPLPLTRARMRLASSIACLLYLCRARACNNHNRLKMRTESTCNATQLKIRPRTRCCKLRHTNPRRPTHLAVD